MDREPSDSYKDNAADPENEQPPSIREHRQESEEAATASGAKYPDDNQQPAHPLKILLRGHSLLDWISLGFTLALVLIGTFYTFYAAKQWEAMRRALGQTDAALELNRETLELNRRQTMAAETSANAAGKSIETAKQGLQYSQDSFHIDQRPYLVAEKFGFIEGGPGPDKPAKANVFFRNIGRTPATQIAIYRSLFLMQPQRSSADVDAAVEKEFALARASTGKAGEHDVAPQSELFTTAQSSSLTPQDLEAFRSGKEALYLIGGVVYGDPFGARHETQCCVYFFGEDINVWHFCDVHNMIR
jgi:hypothetical protein